MYGEGFYAHMSLIGGLFEGRSRSFGLGDYGQTALSAERPNRYVLMPEKTDRCFAILRILLAGKLMSQKFTISHMETAA